MQAPSWPCAIPGQALIRGISIESSTPSTPRSPVEQAWGCRFAAPSSMLMGASCGREQTSLAVLHFSSPCAMSKESSRLLFRRLSRPESLANASCETLFLHRLAQVTHDAVVQRASPVNVIGKRSHEDRRNRLARVDKASVEFEPGHGRHMDVGDQAGCLGEARGRKKFGCGRENVDRMAQRSHEPAHSLTKEPVIVDHRNQYLFHHAAFGHSLDPSCGQPTMPTLRMELPDMRENATSAAPVPHKLWLI